MVRRVLILIVFAASLLSVPGAGARPLRTAPTDRIDRLLERAARAGVPAAALAQARARFGPTDPEDVAYVVEAGDLDGDGLTDLLDLRDHGVPRDELDGWTVYHYTTTVAAYRGRDAGLLWTRTFAEDEWVLPLPARVGPAGKRGVIFAVYSGLGAGLVAAGAGNYGLGLAAVDGTGDELWSRIVPGGYAGVFAPAGYAAARAAPALAGIFDGVRGPATDLLVTLGAAAGGEPGWLAREQLLVVSGADGTLTDTGVAVVQRDGYLDAQPTPDLDRDGLADFAISSGAYDAARTTISAYRSSGGAPLWTTTVPSAYAGRLVGVGDATGDGIADLAATTKEVQSGRDEASSHLLDGGTGARRWTKRGQAFPAGDVNRDRRTEVTLLRQAADGRASVRAETYDAAGVLRWRTIRALPAPAANSDRDCPTPGVCTPPPPPPGGVAAQEADGSDVTTFVGPGGDMNADGITDFGYAIVVSPRGERARRDEGWIDGRTGRVRRDPAENLVMLNGAVDGRGADAATTTVTGGRLTVTVYAADNGRVLWRTTIGVAVGYRSPFGTTAVNLTSRRCAAVVVTVRGEHTFQTIAFGPTGLPVWSITRDGGSGPPKPVRPAVHAHTHRNGCR